MSFKRKMLRLYSRYISGIITKQQNFNLWNTVTLHPFDAQFSILFDYRSFYGDYRSFYGDYRNKPRACVHSHRPECQLSECVPFVNEAHIRYHFQYCARWTRKVLGGGRGWQALLSQTHGQYTTENTHFRGQRSEQAIHIRPGGIMPNSPVYKYNTTSHLLRNRTGAQ